MLLNFAKIGNKGEMIPMHTAVVYSIFFSPEPYPMQFVLQRCDFIGPLCFTGLPFVHTDYDTVRANLPKGLICAGRELTNPPSLLENWISEEGKTVYGFAKASGL